MDKELKETLDKLAASMDGLSASLDAFTNTFPHGVTLEDGSKSSIYKLKEAIENLQKKL